MKMADVIKGLLEGQRSFKEYKRRKELGITPRQLPTIMIGKKTYYVDERLMQVRNVKNPHDYIDFHKLHKVKGYTMKHYNKLLDITGSFIS